ncbi:MAG: hypothetical protein V1715_04345 [bacterium]
MNDNPFIQWLASLSDIYLWILGLLTVIGLLVGLFAFLSSLSKIFLFLKKHFRTAKWYLSGRKKSLRVAINVESAINSIIDKYSFNGFTFFDKYVHVKPINPNSKKATDDYIKNDSDRLIIPIKDSESLENSVANAVVGFSKEHILIQEKNYSEKSMSAAIDLHFCKKIVMEAGGKDLLTCVYRIFNIQSHSTVENQWFNAIDDIFNSFDYGSIFINELRFLVDSFYPRTPTRAHSSEIASLARYIESQVNYDKSDVSKLQHSSSNLHIGLVIMADKAKRKMFGIKKHGEAIRYCIRDGCDRIYLMAGGFVNNNAAKSLCLLLKYTKQIEVIWEREAQNVYIT